MTGISKPLTLVVDPEEETRDLYGAILAPVATEIEYSEDGRDALAKAIGRPPSFVIAETHLPFINGYALCSLLRAEPSTAEVPIILITGDADPGCIRRACSSGADRILFKPYAPEALLEAVARGRDRSVDRAGSAAAMRRQDDSLVRAHRRFETSTPPVAPPSLRCPFCDQPLRYARSFIGGVSARLAEQWDYYACANACGMFRYRQRTRRLRRVQ